MNAQQRDHADELHDLATRYQWLRELFVQKRDWLIDAVQAATRDIEEVDEKLLCLLELQRDLAAEVERTEGVA